MNTSGPSPNLTTTSPWKQLVADRLFGPVDVAPLVFFRVFFGAMMFWEVLRYFNHGWIARYYIEPEFFFTFQGFGWVHPWPGQWMYVHFVVLAVLAVFIALGLWYRICAALFFLGFTYIFLLDRANYLNHFYLISLISFLIVWMPAHRAASLDALMRPKRQALRVPAWSLNLLRAQIGIVYLFGGIAKLNGDWLGGEPMGTWLADRAGSSAVPFLLDASWSGALFSYAGLAIDLAIVPLLIWRRTRLVAFGVATVFHLTNAYLFSIGIFPWFMIGATLLFFDASSFAGIRRKISAGLHVPSASRELRVDRSRRKTVALLVGAYLFVQVVVPLRHFLYPGNVSWTEEGHNFSWHMKLRDKRAAMWILARDTLSGQTWTVDLDEYLTPRQESKMVTRPAMLAQFARYIRDRYREEGRPDVSVHAFGNVSLNGREGQLLVDPDVDLASVELTLRHRDWILPLEDEPLENEPLEDEQADP